MLFQAVMKFCLDLLSSKFWLIREWSIQLSSQLQVRTIAYLLNLFVNIGNWWAKLPSTYIERIIKVSFIIEHGYFNWACAAVRMIHITETAKHGRSMERFLLISNNAGIF